MATAAVGQIGVGIVGIGFGRAVHLPALRLDPRFNVRAICASTLPRAGRIAEECGIPQAYGDWRELLAAPGIDAVTIAVPPPLQPALAVAALEAGKHVFCEKPLADTVAAAARMASTAAASRLANMVDFEFTMSPAWVAAKQALEAQHVGRLRSVHAHWHVETYAMQHRLDSWKTDASGGGALLSFASHSFHYLEWLAGPIRRLRAWLHRQPDEPGNADSMAQVQFEFLDGAAGSLTASSNSPFGSGHRLEIYGEGGALHLVNSTRDYLDGFTLHCVNRQGEVPLQFADQPESTSLARAKDAAAKDGRIRAVAGLLRRFADAIEKGTAARPDFRDGLRVQRLLEASRDSQATGNWIDVSQQG